MERGGGEGEGEGACPLHRQVAGGFVGKTMRGKNVIGFKFLS